MKKFVKKAAVVGISAALAAGCVMPVSAAEQLKGTADVKIEFNLDGEVIRSVTGADPGAIENGIIDINVAADEEKGLIGENIDITINGTHIAGADIYAALADMIVYIQSPELSESFLKLDFNELMNMMSESMGESAGVSSGGASPVEAAADSAEEAADSAEEAADSAEEAADSAEGESTGESASGESMSEEQQAEITEFLETAAEKYIAPLMAAGRETSASSEIKVNDKYLKIDYTGIAIDFEAAADTLMEVLEEMKNDEQLLESISSLSGAQVPKEEWDAAIDEGIAGIAQLVASGEIKDSGIFLMAGTDETGACTNAYAELVHGNMQMRVADFVGYTDETGTSSVFLTIGADEEVLSVNAAFRQDDNGILKGEADIFVTGQKVGGIEAEINTLKSEGTVVIYADLYEGRDIELTVGYAENFAEFALALHGQKAVTLTITAGEGRDMEFPDAAALEGAVNMLNDDEMNAFAESVDQTKIENNLEKAGLLTIEVYEDPYAAEVESALQQLEDELQSAIDGELSDEAKAEIESAIAAIEGAEFPTETETSASKGIGLKLK
ncbi:MAG: hypothetical protein HUJ76_00525 [Parasporobacterium sp.]|nr:hypothetical protein [Parasporobacterium sp.]